MLSRGFKLNLIFLFFISIQLFGAGKFGAYYTKINSGEDFEKYSRTGDYTDITVDLGNNLKFIFWRGSSYLPYLESNNTEYFVDEIVHRSGDGDAKRPDQVNFYSHAEIIESISEKVVIHWRYLPEFGGTNPHTGVSPTEFVDEYYYIKQDGSVKRTIRKGTHKIDDWNDPENCITQTFLLTTDGIQNKVLTSAKHSFQETKIVGSPVISKNVVNPVVWWKFDEGINDVAKENVSGFNSEIVGNKSLWRKGVSGTSLQFDGYNTKIILPSDKAPKLSNAVTLEGWMSIGAYPWSYVPLVQQANDVSEEIESTQGQKAVLTGEDEEGNDEEEGNFDFVLKKENDTGYFFGLNGYGNPVFKLRVGNEWEELTADFHLERRVWYHLAATYSKDSGLMKIFVDGLPVAEKKVAKSDIELSSKDLKIGQGKERRPIRPVRMNTFKDIYSFDGLIDEIKIYDVALTPDQINKSYHLYDTNKGRRAIVDMDERVLPTGDGRGEFGGYYTHLKFYDVWDNMWRFSDHPDVVVGFDNNPSKFIFWRGVGYIPMMVNEKGQWYSNEFNETWSTSGGNGCQEPMSDKESYNNYVKVLENTPARVVVQWRFPLIDVNHVMANYNSETGWCDVSDWYYYIYPDGVAVKTMHLWTEGERNHEWQESMAIFGPNQHPEQIIETKNALTMVNMKGDYKSYDWINGPPKSVESPDNRCIQYINYTGDYDPVTIGDFKWTNVYGGEITPYAVFPTWNHWPVAQMPSDGRYAIFPDRTSHSSLTHVGPPIYKELLDGPAPYYEKIMMEGMLKSNPTALVPLAKSWMNAPEIVNLNGAEGEYLPEQRAYILTKKNGKITFTINSSEDNPICNACFVVKGWNSDKLAKIVIDKTESNIVKQGIIRDTDGTNTLTVWIEKESNVPVNFEIISSE